MLLDIWVGESDGSAIVGNDVGDLVSTHGLSDDLAELEGSFLFVNFVSLVSSLNIVEETEVLAGLLDGNDVHNTKWESGISSDFVVNLDQSFLVLNDFNDLLSGKSVLQSVSQKD